MAARWAPRWTARRSGGGSDRTAGGPSTSARCEALLRPRVGRAALLRFLRGVRLPRPSAAARVPGMGCLGGAADRRWIRSGSLLRAERVPDYPPLAQRGGGDRSDPRHLVLPAANLADLAALLRLPDAGGDPLGGRPGGDARAEASGVAAALVLRPGRQLCPALRGGQPHH